jgi:hypothetical protein
MAFASSLVVATFKFLSEQNQSVSFMRDKSPAKRLTLDGQKYTTLAKGVSTVFFDPFLAKTY